MMSAVDPRGGNVSYLHRIRRGLPSLDNAPDVRPNYGMTTLEYIQQEIKTLPTAEQFSLWQALGRELNAVEQAADAGVALAWDAEIESRLHDIKSGKVASIPGEVFEQRTRSLFAELGIEFHQLQQLPWNPKCLTHD